MLYIHKNIYKEIMKTIGDYIPERGGVLGAVPGKPISRYYFDAASEHHKDYYEPDISGINHVLTDDWYKDGIYLMGVIHSHESTCLFPSCGDLIYAEQILRSLAYTKEFYMPIITQNPFQMHGYVVSIGSSGLVTRKVRVMII